MKNLTIIGTSHIAKSSVEQVKAAILDGKPDIVAVELDHARLHALLSMEKPKASIAAVRIMGLAGFAFFTLGGFLQRRLGKMIGAVPGEEMKAAVETAMSQKTRVALIDQPVNVTMQGISKIGLREKLRLVKDLLLGFAGMGEGMPIDLTKVPEEKFIQMAMKKIRERYPGLYKALVADRNEYMARMLSNIIKHEPEAKILAVVGAGHEKEMKRILQRIP